MGYCPWGRKTSDTTEMTQHTHTHQKSWGGSCRCVWVGRGQQWPHGLNFTSTSFCKVSDTKGTPSRDVGSNSCSTTNSVSPNPRIQFTHL